MKTPITTYIYNKIKHQNRSKLMKNNSFSLKCLKVITSCETMEQLRTAKQYLDFAYKHLSIRQYELLYQKYLNQNVGIVQKLSYLKNRQHQLNQK